MKQTELPFQRHSVTSRNAAESMTEGATSLRAKVFGYLKDYGPASDEKIQEALRMNPSTQRPRRVELLRAGRIEEFGKTKTKSGRSAVLWRVIDK